MKICVRLEGKLAEDKTQLCGLDIWYKRGVESKWAISGMQDQWSKIEKEYQGSMRLKPYSRKRRKTGEMDFIERIGKLSEK